MRIKAEEISRIIKTQIEGIDRKVEVAETGTILTVGDGIARVYGLENAQAGELVEFKGGMPGLILNLEEDNVGIAIFGDDSELREGDLVKRTGRIADVAVGEELCGRVVNAVGEPIDGKGPLGAKNRRRVEIKAPGIIKRQPVKEPLQTGLKSIDAMIPIGSPRWPRWSTRSSATAPWSTPRSWQHRRPKRRPCSSWPPTRA
jgi:F-type H+-transporting ATPase subunit alpha